MTFGGLLPAVARAMAPAMQRGVLVPSRVAHALLRAIVPGGLKQVLARRALRSIGR